MVTVFFDPQPLEDRRRVPALILDGGLLARPRRGEGSIALALEERKHAFPAEGCHPRTMDEDNGSRHARPPASAEPGGVEMSRLESRRLVSHESEAPNGRVGRRIPS